MKTLFAFQVLRLRERANEQTDIIDT